MKFSYGLAIEDEINIGLLCCKNGLLELNKRSGLNPSVFVPFLLLSTGIERLIKCLYWCEFHDKNNKQFPNQIQLKELGHNLEELVKYMCETMEKFEIYKKIPDRIEDYNFLKNNEYFLTFLKLLSDFAIKERYYNLNEITGINEKNKVNPDRGFSTQATNYIQENYSQVLKETMNPQYDNTIIYSITKEQYNRVIQKFLKIYCFCCTQGAFGTTIRQFSAGKLDDFLFLKDEEISSINFSLKN